MNVSAKICGINSEAAMDAAIEGDAAGAAYVGLVFYPPSPRYLSVEAAAALAARVPDGVIKVGLFVDVDDATFDSVLAAVALDMLQLHGGESPARVREIGERCGLPVMKAVLLAGADDLALARDYEDAADMLLFDAKPPATMTEALPGGNALVFDWELLAGESWPIPWMLSGGLDPENVAEAVRIAGASAVDVSSGVESAPGQKDPARIRAFLEAVAAL